MGWSIAMSSRYSVRRWVCLLIVPIGAAALTCGCHLVTSPFVDELAAKPAVTTPSVAAVLEAGAQPRIAKRPHAPVEVFMRDGAVTHGPLYFEDPYEDPDADGLCFALSGGDYLAWLYGSSRFIVNTAMFPASAALAPPWHLVTDDGQAGSAFAAGARNSASSGRSIETGN